MSAGLRRRVRVQRRMIVDTMLGLDLVRGKWPNVELLDFLGRISISSKE